MSIQDDKESLHSAFSDDDGSYSTISLSKLELAVGEVLGIQCTLRKLAEGGNHKIYDIISAGAAADDVKYLLRVPSPDFPVDKLSSEVATLQYIADNTSVPVPKVLAWSTEPFNNAGTEYMILEKIPGASAYDVWGTFKQEAKERLVQDVAVHLISLFGLRFSLAGSLFPEQGTVLIGPLVTTPFFDALDGEVRFPQSARLDLQGFRGPFTRTTDLLSSSPKAELHVIEHRRSELLEKFKGDEALLQLGKRVLEKAVQLVEVYPGELDIGGVSSGGDAARPFSIRLTDFRLGNIMVCLIYPCLFWEPLTYFRIRWTSDLDRFWDSSTSKGPSLRLYGCVRSCPLGSKTT
ncbi:hypothetical protein M413DRAFT_60457 [Hebeloma cylindrosporum]|uniref:Aminoglycoside phosphotransferase domain-containing protein n=1 Tax=Hebeloma cylindrosporum TaxID=76867 RepID=A0A0C3CXT6_HEBCY|nr:hypothetical protein M413DRAFT_60457 [Hebeloma cylindrosporum h7]